MLVQAVQASLCWSIYTGTSSTQKSMMVGSIDTRADGTDRERINCLIWEQTAVHGYES